MVTHKNMVTRWYICKELWSLFNSRFFLSFISGGGDSSSKLNIQSVEDTDLHQVHLYKES